MTFDDEIAALRARAKYLRELPHSYGVNIAPFEPPIATLALDLSDPDERQVFEVALAVLEAAAIKYSAR